MLKKMTKEYLILWDNYIFYKDGRIYSKGYNKERFLKGAINKDGYVEVGLKCTDGKIRHFLWHRVIYTYFNGAIPEGMQINHINEIKTDNRLCNLELVTPKENINHGTRNERAAAKLRGIPKTEEHKAKLSKAVVAVDNDSNVVLEFPSTQEAKRNGFYNAWECCIGKRRTCGGYQWYFKSEWLQIQNASPHKREYA